MGNFEAEEFQNCPFGRHSNSRVQKMPGPLATSRTSILQRYLSLLNHQSFSLHRYVMVACCFQKTNKWKPPLTPHSLPASSPFLYCPNSETLRGKKGVYTLVSTLSSIIIFSTCSRQASVTRYAMVNTLSRSATYLESHSMVVSPPSFCNTLLLIFTTPYSPIFFLSL